jgi:hypothetical protein
MPVLVRTFNSFYIMEIEFAINAVCGSSTKPATAARRGA